MTILVNGNEIASFNFPGGESQVSVSPEVITETTLVEGRLNNADDIMRLLLTIDAIRRILPTVMVELTIPYFPYARQDRVCNEGEALSVRVMADLINNLHCHQVTIIDPHSDVTPALLNNCKIITQGQILAKSSLIKKIREEKWAIISPDVGSQKKSREIVKYLSTADYIPDLFYGDKVRDTVTGKITGTVFHGNICDRHALIVDDICDGGKTFIELAKILRQQQPKAIYLYVTHGIFSKGLDVLKPYFDQVYCYHTMLSPENQDSQFLQILGNCGE